ncbi:putative alpha-mannosyltransferase, nucleotide-diphospho-sugar transferase [Plasmopara halstedii]
MVVAKLRCLDFFNVLKSKLLFVIGAILLVTTIYVNFSLVTNVSDRLSHRLRPDRSHLDWSLYRETSANDSMTTSHPKSIFYRRGENFDYTVSRERSLVVCLHDKMLHMGLSLIRELRCLGNQELIQAYHCGRNELSNQSVEILFGLDNRVELVDVCSDLLSRGIFSEGMSRMFQNWWIKPLALYHTDVRHVMLLDVDDIILRNPDVVRSLDGYLRTGTTFFYDRVRYGKRFLTGTDNDEMYLHRLLRQFNYSRFNISEGFAPSQHMINSFAFRGLTTFEMDSSMVLVDKKRVGKTVMDIIFWFITEERFRFRYSWGDKETFWLAFELAHVPYSFSPWGVSVVNSMPNEDLENHPDSLCGTSILQFMPVHNSKAETAEVLYVNGKALLDPYPQGFNVKKAHQNALFNPVVTHMTPRQQRRQIDKSIYPVQKFRMECLVGMGATRLPEHFARHLLRRRSHFTGLTMGVLGALQHCEMFV